MYSIFRDPATGLWVVVDDATGRRLGRAELPSSAINLAIQQGMPAENRNALLAQAARIQEQEQNQLRTQQRARDDVGTPTVNSGTVVINAQQARDERANQLLPIPPVPASTVPVATNAVPTQTAATQDGAADINTNAPVRVIQQTQSTSSQQPNNVGSLQTSTGALDLGLDTSTGRITPNEFESQAANRQPNVSNDRVGVGAPGDDQRSQSQAVEQTNSVRNRLDELYGGVKNAIVSQDNVLDEYASYTYSLSWYLMDRAAYQRLINQQKKSLNGYHLLVQSAGAGPATGLSVADEQILQYEKQNPQSIPGNVARSPFFPLDYAIDNLEVDVKYAAGSASQSAAAFKSLSFTLTEPNGITLLPNLYRAVEDLVKSGGEIDDSTSVNYASALFCMVIRFYGYDENGVLARPITNRQGSTDSAAVVEKFIPFTLTKIDFSVGSKLVEYKIEGATPDIATGLSTNRGSIPQDFGFSGTTVRDLLVGNMVNTTTPGSETSRNSITETSSPKYNIDGTTGLEMVGYGSYVEPGSKWPSIKNGVLEFLRFGVGKGDNKLKTPSIAEPAPKADAAPKPTNITVGTGLASALNNFQLQQAEKGVVEYPDVYDVVFADSMLADAKVAPPGGVNKNLAGGTATNNAAEKKLMEKNSMSPTTRLRSVSRGVQIVQFIDEVLRNSSYITDQQSVIYDERTKKYEKNGKPAQQFAWFNISVVAEPGPYDRIRNDYAYKMTFFITPYEVPIISEYFNPSGFRGTHKVYNYWFTGQNTQVLSFDQSFDKLWTQVLSADTNLISAVQRQKSQQNSREQWKRHYYTASGQNRQGGDGKTFEAGANAADSLYGPNYANIQATILGDPAWIPNAQYGFGYTQFTSAPFYPDGTINNSSSIPYFDFAWNRPVDYNLNTGLMDPGQNNYFSNRGEGVAGIAVEAQTYVAVSTKNIFRGGRFTQELEGAWVYDQTQENKPADERTAQTPPTIDRTNENQSNAETARLAQSGKPIPPVRVAGDNSSTARGVQQVLSPPTQSLNPTLTQLTTSQAYITARRAGVPAPQALEFARQQFAQGAAGKPYNQQKIVREP